MSASPDDLGREARAFYASDGGTRAVGIIKAHSLVPSVLIENPETGEQIWWRHDLVEVIGEDGDPPRT